MSGTRAPPRPLHAFLTARTGLALSGPQRRRLEARLAERLGGRSEQQYLQHLQSPAGASELAELISAVVVHKTDLFRDEVQLNDFRTHVLEPLVARAGRPLKLWSAGCATGEEVATLLVLLAEAGADPASTVLGTDISEPALARARALRFGAEQMRRVPAGPRERWFVSLGEVSMLASPLRERATFLHHNLMDAPYPAPEPGGGFDIIFCRNVLIYFTPEAFERAVAGLSERLAPGGALVLSAAEPLLRVPPSLRALHSQSAFFYVRADEEAPPDAELARPRRESGGFAAVASVPATAPVRESGRFQAVSPLGGTRPESGRFAAVSRPEPRPVPDAATRAEADALFLRALERAGPGQGEARTEEDLRRCLTLDPELAAARFLLGMLLELRDARAEAAAEYRRALRSLEEGRARAVPFFLNPVRLQVACLRAIERMEDGGRPR